LKITEKGKVTYTWIYLFKSIATLFDTKHLKLS